MHPLILTFNRFGCPKWFWQKILSQKSRSSRTILILSMLYVEEKWYKNNLEVHLFLQYFGKNIWLHTWVTLQQYLLLLYCFLDLKSHVLCGPVWFSLTEINFGLVGRNNRLKSKINSRKSFEIFLFTYFRRSCKNSASHAKINFVFLSKPTRFLPFVPLTYCKFVFMEMTVPLNRLGFKINYWWFIWRFFGDAIKNI